MFINKFSTNAYHIWYARVFT